MQIIRDFKSIPENEYLKQATIIQLQQIKKESLANTRFYSTSFQLKKEELKQLKREKRRKETQGKIFSAVNDLGNIVLCYRFVLQTYCMAYYLEAVLSGNMDADYLCAIQHDICIRLNYEDKSFHRVLRLLSSWYEEAAKYRRGEITKEDYDKWRYFYPQLDKSGSFIHIPTFLDEEYGKSKKRNQKNK